MQHSDQGPQLTLSLSRALWRNSSQCEEFTSISPRVALERCAITLGSKAEVSLLNAVRAFPA